MSATGWPRTHPCVMRRPRPPPCSSRLRAAGVAVTFTQPWGPVLFFGLSRNHKKIYVVDDRAYLGGINISDHNFAWRDFMVAHRGPRHRGGPRRGLRPHRARRAPLIERVCHHQRGDRARLQRHRQRRGPQPCAGLPLFPGHRHSCTPRTLTGPDQDGDHGTGQQLPLAAAPPSPTSGDAWPAPAWSCAPTRTSSMPGSCSPTTPSCSWAHRTSAGTASAATRRCAC